MPEAAPPDATAPAAPAWPVPPDQRDWPPFPFVRSALILTAAVAVLAGVAIGALSAIDRPLMAQHCGIAAGVCLVTGLVGLFPVAWLSRQHPHGSAQGFLISILVRMLLTGAVVMVLIFNRVPGAFPLSLWIGGWYMVVLAVEVRLVSSHALAHAAHGVNQGAAAPGDEPASPPAATDPGAAIG